MEIALGMAVSMAAGVRANFGTSVTGLEGAESRHERHHGGHAGARQTTRRAGRDRGAKHGSSIATGATSRSTKKGSSSARWPIPTTSSFPGVDEFYPCASYCGPPVEATLRLVDEYQITAGQNETGARVRRPSRTALKRITPETGCGARKHQYCVALTLVHGRPQVRHFTDTAVQDPAVREMMRRVTWEPTEQGAGKCVHGTVSIELFDGRKGSTTAQGSRKDTRKRPPSRRGWTKQFIECSGQAVVGTEQRKRSTSSTGWTGIRQLLRCSRSLKGVFASVASGLNAPQKRRASAITDLSYDQKHDG